MQYIKCFIIPPRAGYNIFGEPDHTTLHNDIGKTFDVES